MSIFDGFKAFNFDEGVPYVSVTRNGVTFNRAVIMKLDYPTHIQLLINENTKQVAVLPCAESANNATSFYKEKRNNVVSVRYNGKDLLNTLKAMMEWNLEVDSYRIEGNHIKEENAMLFDFKTATKL